MSELACMIRNDATFAEYAEWDAVNQSRLKLIEVSPKHYQANARAESHAFNVGMSVHTAVLEPEQYPLEYVIYPGKTRRGKEWDAFKAANSDKEIVKENEYQHHLEISRAVRNDPVAGPLLTDGKPEVSILWETAHGYDCKARIDWLKRDCIVDLKTAASVNPSDFERAAYRYGYHTQASWYRHAVYVATGALLRFKIIVVEKTPPFDVAVYSLSDELLFEGEKRIAKSLAILHECMETDTWPGVSQGKELKLELPAWANINSDEFVDSLIIAGEEVSL